MAIYSKKLSGEWLEAFQQYEQISGFEPMYQEDIDAGKMTAREAFNANLNWLRDVSDSCTNISVPYDDD